MSESVWPEDKSLIDWLCDQSSGDEFTAARLSGPGPRGLVHPVHSKDLSWRLYPFGFCFERKGTVVVFDRAYFPIARVGLDRTINIVAPTERIEDVALQWFYADINSPLHHPETFDRIQSIARRLSIQPEIERRIAKLHAAGISDWAYLNRDFWPEFFYRN